jgi:magnesium transporter
MLRGFAIDANKLRERELDANEPQAQLQSLCWIDLQDPTDEERLWVEQCHPQALPEADEVEEIESSARYFIEGRDIHVHSLFLTQSEGRYNTTTVAFTLAPERLLSFHDVDLADFRLIRLRARRGWIETRNPLQLLTTIFTQKVDNLADQLEDLHTELEEIGHEVLESQSSGSHEQALDRLARLEDSNGKIRLCLMDTQRSISFLMRHIRNQTEEQEACREILRDLDTLMSHATFMFEKINFLMDAALGFINIRQNQIIKTFSIAAVVFLPPTLVASIYGMNFAHIPELAWSAGYPLALGAMVVSGIAPYLLFKHKGWL